MKKIVVSFAVIVISVSVFLYLTNLNSNDIIGEITIEIIDENEIETSSTYNFDLNDSLFDIIDKNYDVKCANSSYQLSDTCSEVMYGSRVVLQIGNVITNWDDNFISIYENDVYSTLGIDSIVLNDGDYFIFQFQEVGGN